MWLDIVKTIGGVINHLIQSNKEKDLRISHLMWDIHLLLEDVIIKFESNEYPHTSCSTMNVLTMSLFDKIKPSLGDKSIYVSNLLKEASNLEKSFNERGTSDIINQLKVASGEFKGFSILLKS